MHCSYIQKYLPVKATTTNSLIYVLKQDMHILKQYAGIRVELVFQHEIVCGQFLKV